MQLPFSGTRAVFLSLICAGVLSILGVFGLQVQEVGAAPSLTSPSTIIDGSQYGEVDDFGSFAYNAWRPENQKNRKMLSFVLPTTQQQVLFIAYINDDAAACSGTACRIEFRMSFDTGLTWMQPIGSATKWIMVDDVDYLFNNPAGIQYDYSLYLDPDVLTPNIWVSYSTTGGAKVQKLSWNPLIVQAPWQITEAPFTVRDGNQTNEYPINAIGVQKRSTGEYFFWGVVVDNDNGGDNSEYYLVYCQSATGLSSDCSGEGNWHQWAFGSGVTTFLGNGYARYGIPPYARVVFTPSYVSDGYQVPMLTMVKHRIIFDTTNAVGTKICVDSQGIGSGIEYFYLQYPTNPTGNTSWVKYSGVLHNRYPFSYTDNIGSFDCALNAYALTNSVVKPFDFTVTARPTTSDNAIIYFAIEGGHSDGGDPYDVTANDGDITIIRCSLNKDLGPQGCTVKGLAGSFRSPSIGFFSTFSDHQNRLWIAAKNSASGDNLSVFEEIATDSNTYTGPQTFTGSGTVMATTMPMYVPYNSSSPMALNSELPPIAWPMGGTGQKIAFSTNNGGNLFGWGWSSNFGWLSLNCANEGLASPVCTFPYGTKVGPVISTTPTAAAFSPNGYPLSGYSWSSNAGWFSFNRIDSACFGTCTGETNALGNPPGQAYYNGSTNTDPIAKYDPVKQQINGWGRFLNLCNFTDYDAGAGIDAHCAKKTGGWVRMRGYWRKSIPKSSTLQTAFTTTTLPIEIDLNDSTTFPASGIVEINGQYFSYTGKNDGNGHLTGVTERPPSVGYDLAIGSVVNLTYDPADSTQGGPYGVDGYWSRSRYEVSGWAWSAEYGWIHFRPTLFAGFAWLETLFGNIYAQEGITLPNPQDASATRIDTCDTDGNGSADEPCYTATYRIEAGGVITPLIVSGTGQSGGSASSAISYIQGLAVGGKQILFPNDGSLDDPTTGITGRQNSPSGILFPTVSPDSTTFRNALGKIDVGALTTFVGTPDPETHSPSDVKYGKDNRLGNELIKTDQGVLGVVTWNLSDLVGYAPASGSAQLWASLPLNTLRNQVIHVQGDLEMLPSDDAQTTITSNYAAGAVTMQVANTVNFPKSGYLIVNAGTSTEEYFRYTAVPDGTHFSLTSLRTPALAHASGQSVRWAWKLPDSVAADGKADTATIVVDGDLNIQYNIFSQTPSGITDIKQVPTLAFIVRGNVNIAKEVNRVDSAFIVLSRDSTKDPGTNCVAPDSCSPYTHWGGVFDTGDDVALCDAVTKKCNPLKIKGMLFARQFKFQRVGDQNLKSPGEQVTFDSNLLLNPPPGLGDLTKALPRITRINQ